MFANQYFAIRKMVDEMRKVKTRLPWSIICLACRINEIEPLEAEEFARKVDLDFFRQWEKRSPAQGNKLGSWRTAAAEAFIVRYPHFPAKRLASMLGYTRSNPMPDLARLMYEHSPRVYQHFHSVFDESLRPALASKLKHNSAGRILQPEKEEAERRRKVKERIAEIRAEMEYISSDLQHWKVGKEHFCELQKELTALRLSFRNQSN